MIDRDTDPLSFCINFGQTSPKYIETPTATTARDSISIFWSRSYRTIFTLFPTFCEDQGRAANKSDTRQQTSKRVATFIETFRSRQEQEQEISQLLSSAVLILDKLGHSLQPNCQDSVSKVEKYLPENSATLKKRPDSHEFPNFPSHSNPVSTSLPTV